MGGIGGGNGDSNGGRGQQWGALGMGTAMGGIGGGNGDSNGGRGQQWGALGTAMGDGMGTAMGVWGDVGGWGRGSLTLGGGLPIGASQGHNAFVNLGGGNTVSSL